jgi:hypothetical protein
MTLRAVVPGLLVAVLVGACASSPKVERPVGPPPRVLFQSPIALLFQHHDELLLTTDQMIALGKLDQALEKKNKLLREKLREARRQRMEQQEGPPPRDGMGAGRGGGGGMGAMGGMGGHGMVSRGTGGGEPESIPPLTEETLRQMEVTLREMEDNESAAYNEAEQLLDEKQKVRARELVTQQREDRMRVREALHQRVAAPKT